MIYVNNVTLVGRLTRDIDLRKSSNNTSFCGFTVAITRRYQSQQNNGQEASDFVSCIAWRQQADFLANYASKGTIVGVEGRIQSRSYDGPNGKVYTQEVVAEHVQIISNRNSNNVSAGTSSNNYAGNNSNSYGNSSYASNSYNAAPASNNNQTFTPGYEPGYESDNDFNNDTPSLDISSDDLPFY